jgi:hypothetical protein
MATLCSSLRASQARINKGKKCSQLHDLAGPDNNASIEYSRFGTASHGLCEARTRYICVAIWYISIASILWGFDPAEANPMGTFLILLSRSLRWSWYSSLRLVGSRGSTNVPQISERRFNIACVGYIEGNSYKRSISRERKIGTSRELRTGLGLTKGGC